MITGAFRMAGGCAVADCDADIAVVMELLANPVNRGGGWSRILQVALCAHHGEEMAATREHPAALINGQPRQFYRAIVVVDGASTHDVTEKVPL